MLLLSVKLDSMRWQHCDPRVDPSTEFSTLFHPSFDPLPCPPITLDLKSFSKHCRLSEFSRELVLLSRSYTFFKTQSEFQHFCKIFPVPLGPARAIPFLPYSPTAFLPCIPFSVSSSSPPSLPTYLPLFLPTNLPITS